MKRTLLIFLIIFILMQFIRVDQTNVAVEKDLEIKAPIEIMTIFKNSCYDCHSNEVKWPWYSQVAPFSWTITNHVDNGRDWLNFSIWETYTDEEKEKRLKGIYRTAYAIMPLPTYIWLHKEADLTKEQRNLIRDWTGVRKYK
ncbi:heme-binding domain-containing protein [Poseidonibacter lekithochrous]|uniref:heme-binding domain-containing protein n=1 Tax=Poseidonibacter TaxID=2321187 RepID=UPI001C0954F5|nr:MULTISPECIES: heme-binding domain-containing protein [Poseidonibacter]MBU3015320.1 heme-binding domain-containing protein [Poseidonibacter lekithochrous]MDO6828617.1 heme-binding domain-containing protein [Poseidonibacter sp. 1_MG-2023]